MNTELHTFVRDALARGTSTTKIRETLLAAGWRGEEADAALAAWGETDIGLPVPRRRPQLSAREAFLYLVLFATLYIFAFDVGAILFSIIDRRLPDAAANPYARDFAMDVIRWSTSGVLIALPVFLYLSRLIGRTLAREPEKRGSAIRRWLTYLTLFVAAIVLISNFVVLVSGFLSGELTTRVLLKSLVVFAIAATVFGHYLGGLRREEAEGPAAPLRTGWLGRFGAIASVIVVIAGLFTIGSPQRARSRELDQRRARALQTISRAVELHRSQYGRLPASLDEMAPDGLSPRADRRDPVTQAPYGYTVLDSLTYELCATFAIADSLDPGSQQPSDFWRHPAGAHCFRFHLPPRNPSETTVKVPPVH